jgi:hypothetical protein
MKSGEKESFWSSDARRILGPQAETGVGRGWTREGKRKRVIKG